MKQLLLSTRIKQRMKHCQRCGGTGTVYAHLHKEHPLHIACADCSDWRVVLRGVRQLEHQLRDRREK